MDFARRSAFLTGLFFLITIIASIPAVILYAPLLSDPYYIAGPGADGAMSLGALLEILTGMANVGTAVVLFPILKHENEALALGYVGSRISESVIIAVGIIAVLAVVTLRQAFAGDAGGDASLLAAGRALVAVHDRTFLLGPGILAGFGNGLMLGYMMFRTGLVPRPMALLGLIGGPLVSLSGLAVLFGLYPQISPVSAIATVPEFLWELSLGIFLLVKGFSTTPRLASATYA